MDKALLLSRIVAALETDMEVLRRAAQTAYEAATAEENIAENKYDTLGLEAAYLAAGQARRVEEIRQALKAWQALPMRDYDEAQGIGLGALVSLRSAAGRQQHLLLGPDGAGLKLPGAEGEIMLITPRAPLGQQLLGLGVGDEVGSGTQRWTIVRVR